MPMYTDDYKIKLTKLYNQGKSATDQFCTETRVKISQAYGIMSREFTVIKDKTYDAGKNACTTDYSPQLMVLMFSIPVVGYLFWFIKERDYSIKQCEALESDNHERSFKVIELKNEMIKSQLVSMAVKIMICLAMGSLSIPILIVYGAIATFQFLRLWDNEASLEKYKQNGAIGALAKAF